MNKWLADFAYRTPFTWWVFIQGGLIMIFIALFTLSIQTIRSAWLTRSGVYAQNKSIIMIKNYFKTDWRNLLKNSIKLY
ncbi:MAG: hypothetical protein WDO16_02630 [Bacteroidota bacterium]